MFALDRWALLASVLTAAALGGALLSLLHGFQTLAERMPRGQRLLQILGLALDAKLPAPYRRWADRALRAAGRSTQEMAGQLALYQLMGLTLASAMGFAWGAWGGPWFISALLPLGGGVLPWVLLVREGQRRGRAAIGAFPPFLDLLTVAVEAGLDFVQALSRVTERSGPGPLREELQGLLRHLQLGLTREEALKALAVRLALPPVQRWVLAMVQADRTGVGLARMLRTQAQRLRTDEAHRAEAAALRTPIKLLFPLLLLIFPGTFLVLLGPLLFELMVQAGPGGR